MNIELPNNIRHILNQIPRSFVVGGFVRDSILGVRNKDIDVEVFGISFAELNVILSRFGKTNLVGQNFGVIKLTIDGDEFDFSIPRRDNSNGLGHRDFDIELCPDITLEEAARRRDFTINALFFDPRTNEIIDPFDGLSDIKARRLRVVDRSTFKEDPLRVLRAVQFAARFNLAPDRELISLADEALGSFDAIPKERVWNEFEKLAVKGRFPSQGIKTLLLFGWLSHFPEIGNLLSCEQEPEWHPEENVLFHTWHCLNHLVTLDAFKMADRTGRAVLFFAVLCHDFGKPSTTEIRRRKGVDRITANGHEQAGVPFAEVFLRRIGTPNEIIDKVKPLVGNHLAHLQANTKRAVRRLSLRLAPATIDELITVIEADHGGRPPLPAGLPKEATFLRMIARDLDLESDIPKPILKGRHLIDKGLSPSKRFGSILHAAFEIQLDGGFDDEASAVEWLTNNWNELNEL